MKICLVNNLYPPHTVGGAEEVVYQEVGRMLKAGYEVVVITTALGGAHLWRERGLTIYRFEPRNLYFYTEAYKQNFLKRFFWHFFNIFHFGSTRHIKRILEKEKPDRVYTHNLMGVGFLLPRLLKKLKLEHVHVLHDVQLVEPSGVIPVARQQSWRYSGFPSKIYTFTTKMLFGSPAKVISPSNFLKDFYLKKGFFPESEWEVTKGLVSVKKSDKTYKSRFLFVGSLSTHKGVEVLLRAWDRLVKNTHIHLDIVGGGVLEPMVRDWADKKENVVVYGRLLTQQLSKVYKTSDVLIFASTALENRPNVIVEALNNGLFVIATDTGGVKELLVGVDGCKLIEPDNIDALVEAVEKII